MVFTPVPMAGTSGTPIVDAANGTVVGVVLGSKIETGKHLGYGTPAEALYEVCTNNASTYQVLR